MSDRAGNQEGDILSLSLLLSLSLSLSEGEQKAHKNTWSGVHCHRKLWFLCTGHSGKQCIAVTMILNRRWKNQTTGQSGPLKKIQTLVCVKPNIDIGGWHQTVKNHIGYSDLFVWGFICQTPLFAKRFCKYKSDQANMSNDTCLLLVVWFCAAWAYCNFNWVDSS